MSDTSSNASDIIYEYVSKIAKENADKSYDVDGTVTHIEDGTVFVKFENSDIETPVEQTISVKQGDHVKVRVANRKAWIVGNSTEPPTGDAKAIEAAVDAGLAKINAATAQQAANAASNKAGDALYAATTGVDKKIAMYDAAVQRFTNLLANAYGMYRSEIEDPDHPGAYIYALHNADTYETSTFAMYSNSGGLFMAVRESVEDTWTITSALASNGEALVKSIAANSAIIDILLSRDVTVTGALHSDDYIPAATGASPPYSQQGMGLDFGEKEFEAENFAIDSFGRLFAKAGEIAGWEITETGLRVRKEYTSQGKNRLIEVWLQIPHKNSAGQYTGDILYVNDEELNESGLPVTGKRLFQISAQGSVIMAGGLNSQAGGSFTGSLNLSRYDTDTIYCKLRNSNFEGGLYATLDGKFGFWDVKNDKWILYVNNSGLAITDLPFLFNNQPSVVKDNSVKSLTTVSANYYGKGFYLRDSADYDLSYLRHVFLTDGRQGLQLETRAIVGGATKYNTVNLYINNSTGEKTVQLSDPHAWCKAMLADHVTTPNSFFSLTNNHATCGWTSLQETRKTLFNENLASSGQYLMAITNNWEKGGYVAVGSVRNLIGAKITQLYSGTFKSGSVTFSLNYDFFIIYGTSGGNARESVVVPKAVLGTSNTTVLISDDETWLSVYLKYSGSTVTMTWRENKQTGGGVLTSGYINRVYGVNG